MCLLEISLISRNIRISYTNSPVKSYIHLSLSLLFACSLSFCLSLSLPQIQSQAPEIKSEEDPLKGTLHIGAIKTFLAHSSASCISSLRGETD